MKNLIIVGSVILILCGIIYWQHISLEAKRFELQISEGNIKGLQSNIKQIQNSNRAIQNRRAKLAKDSQKGNQNEIMEYLALPVPDGLRGAAENYINSAD